jgi:LacI family transcriptional regulator
MVRPDTPFFARLSAAFQRIAATLDPSIVVHRTLLDENDPPAVARRIADPGFRRSGLIIVAPNHPEVRARLAEAKAIGTAVVHITSRIDADDQPFIGIDNYAAGRTAAYYMASMVKRRGSLVALCHSGAYLAHRERIAGFSDYLAENPNPQLHFALVMLGLDNHLRSAELFEDALKATPDIVGIYNAGGADTGVASVLEKRRRDERIMWIGHELTDDTRRWLQTGLMDIVLDQAPEVQARRALDTVLNRIGFLDLEVSPEPVPFLTVNRQNL